MPVNKELFSLAEQEEHKYDSLLHCTSNPAHPQIDYFVKNRKQLPDRIFLNLAAEGEDDTYSELFDTRGIDLSHAEPEHLTNLEADYSVIDQKNSGTEKQIIELFVIDGAASFVVGNGN